MIRNFGAPGQNDQKCYVPEMVNESARIRPFPVLGSRRGGTGCASIATSCRAKGTGDDRRSIAEEYDMTGYFSQFQIVGEVADMLMLNEPKKRLLVDISTDEPGHERKAFRKYPNRTTLTIEGDEQIAQFVQTFGIGDVAEMQGGITQTEYVPHKTTCIDTVLLVSSFRKLPRTRPGFGVTRAIKVQKGGAPYH